MGAIVLMILALILTPGLGVIAIFDVGTGAVLLTSVIVGWWLRRRHARSRARR